MGIIIGADIVPTASNAQLFAQGDCETLFGPELLRFLSESDYRIANLEVPLTDRQSPITKYGPNLIAPVSSAKGLKALGFDLLAMANNHIMDQDVQGLESTVKALEDNGIAHVGAGKGLSEARTPHFFSAGGKRFGVYACAEHEFSIAGDEKAGANPFDPLESPDHVAEMKKQCDYAIVLYHGGKEYYRYPSPGLRKVCRKLVEKGADLVLCQHSHCIGSGEEYLHGTIIYGQGNFLFDDGENEYLNTGLLVVIGEDKKITYLPIEKKGNGVRLAEGKNAEEILNGFLSRSGEIKKPGFIEKKYADFAKEKRDGYMLSFHGIHKNPLFRLMNKLSGHRFQKKAADHYRRKYGLAIRNYIECEAHRELVLKGLGNMDGQ